MEETEIRRVAAPGSRAFLRYLFWCGPVLLLAFGSRLHGLGVESLWLDEGFSYQMVRQDPLVILTSVAAIDNHPPLHYLVLWAWMRLIGTSEFALRALSVVCGVVTVALLAQLGRRLFGPATGLAAAALLAVSPFHIWYSQEARMYALLTVWAVAAMSAYATALEDGRHRWWVAVAVLDTLAMYTHYYGFFLIVAQLLSAVIALVRRRATRLQGTLEVAALTGLAYAPWLIAVLQQYQRAPHDYAPPLGLLDVIRNVITVFAVGEIPPAGSDSAIWGLLALVALGVVAWRLKPSFSDNANAGPGAASGTALATSWLAATLLVPYMLATVLALDLRVAGKMYYIIALPAYCLLAGRGMFLVAWALTRLLPTGRRARPLVGSGIVAAVLFWMVSGSWSATASQFATRHKEDFRGAANYVMEREWPGDTIILHAEHIYYPFDYYYRGTSRWHRSVMGDEARVDAALREMTAGSTHAWLVLSHDLITDPNGLILTWFQRHGVIIDEAWLNGVRVVAFLLRAQGDCPPAVSQPVSIDFGKFARLVGQDLPTAVEAGTNARIVLNWQVLGSASEEYHQVLMLTDDEGRVWSQLDRIPMGGAYGPTQWRQEECLLDRCLFPVPLGTPPGKYRLRLFLYAPSSGQALPVLRGDDRPILGTLAIERASQATTRRESARLGFGQGDELADEVRLLNARCEYASVSPGDTIRADLVWQAARVPKRHYSLVVRLLDRNNKVVLEETGLPLSDVYPITEWTEGEVVRDWHELRLPLDLDSGEYHLLVGLSDAGQQPKRTVEFGRIRVNAPDRLTTQPPVQFAQTANLGDSMELVGFDLDDRDARPGGVVRLRLTWKALDAVGAAYTVFTHVLTDDNRMVGQKDGIPCGGARPTTTWVKGEYIVDDYAIAIAPGTLDGDYLVEVGMYLPSSGQRLRSGAEDRIILSERVRVRGK